MPKSTRDNIKQSLDTVMGQLEKAEERLVVIGQFYEADHPDYYENYCAIVLSLNTVRKAVEQIKYMT